MMAFLGSSQKRRNQCTIPISLIPYESDGERLLGEEIKKWHEILGLVLLEKFTDFLEYVESEKERK